MRFLPILLAACAALAPEPALAFQIPLNFCGFGVGVGLSGCGGGGVAGLSGYAAGTVVDILGVLFIGVAVAMFAYYAAIFITSSNDESKIKEAKTAYAHAITGGAIVSLASLIVFAFTPGFSGPGSAVVNVGILNIGFSNVIVYIKLILSAALTVNLVTQGTRMIAAQEQGEIDKAKKRLLFGFIGVGFILVANMFVTAAFPPLSGAASGIALEIRGLANFLLVAFALLAVIAFIMAGVMLVISTDEQLKEKSKTVIKTSVISMAVVIAAYALVNAFATLPAP